MDTFKSAAHLQREIGDERFQALISSDNTQKVKDFCDQIIRDAILTMMTVGGRTYNALGFIEECEKSAFGHTVVFRSKDPSVHLGEDDGQHILKHQEEIPAELRGEIVFVFMDWRHPDISGDIAGICWYDSQWVQGWIRLESQWGGNRRMFHLE